jgi:PhzF family phenazine biosynthesis protein
MDALSSARLPFWQVDAFTKNPFAGNPAAIFLLRETLPDALLQRIAIEMNQSETAFVLLRGEAERPLLRWFTTSAEIDLCGHATLAAAHVYLNENALGGGEEVTFETVFAGPLRVLRQGEDYIMDFPARKGDEVALDTVPLSVLNALGPIQPVAAFQARDLMLVYSSEQAVRDIAPDMQALCNHTCMVIVTAQCMSDPKCDFISRFFCPQDSVQEDPVTGSAHCTLAPYWAARLGKQKLFAFQASARGGELALEMVGDRVLITGQAVTVLDGTMRAAVLLR